MVFQECIVTESKNQKTETISDYDFLKNQKYKFKKKDVLYILWLWMTFQLKKVYDIIKYLTKL